MTICSYKHECVFGEIANGEIKLNEQGYLIDQKIQEMPKYYGVGIDSYCVMPNHVHIIMVIPHGETLGSFDGRTRGSAPTIGEYIKRLKTITTKKQKIWQRNYYEHIIRDDGDLQRIREYIKSNLNNWEMDKLNIG